MKVLLWMNTRKVVGTWLLRGVSGDVLPRRRGKETLLNCVQSRHFAFHPEASFRPVWQERSMGLISADHQSQTVPGPEGARTNPLLPDPQKLLTWPKSGVRTVYDMLMYGLKIAEDEDCLGTRSKTTGKYEWIPYREVWQRSQHVGSGLIQLGLNPGKESFVGIITRTRPEFSFTIWGCSTYGMVLVPFNDTLNIENVIFIVNQADLKLIICESTSKAKELILNKQQMPTLQIIVTMDPVDGEISSEAERSGLKLLSFSELENLGRQSVQSPKPPQPDDMFGIVYTSGSTGRPKGSIMTHKNWACWISGIESGSEVLGEIVPATQISYLPAGHLYEISWQISCMYFGSRTGFYSGDPRKLLDDMQELKPTYVPMVPRILTRVYNQVMEELEGHPTKKAIFKFAMKRKKRACERLPPTTRTIWDKLVLHKISNLFGGQVKALRVSSAPMSYEIMDFFRHAMGCYVLESYGQTEVIAVTGTVVTDKAGGSVGAVMPHAQIKLADVPEMNYFAKDGVGEICVRGDSVSPGYFKDPSKTLESRDANGWLLTGDIGRWLPNGALSVIDRKKNIFKLSQGIYIAPEKVENIYSESPLVLQVFVDGSSLQDYIVAIVVPNPEVFPSWLKKKGFAVTSTEEAFESKEVRSALLKDIIELGKKRGLLSVEQAKNIYLQEKPFTIEDGLLTPTLKVKRNVARQRLASVVQRLYEEQPLIV